MSDTGHTALVRVKPLEWTPTKTLNRNDYHGSKPFVVEYVSVGEFRYTLSANYQVGASWDARRGTTTPIKGGTCVSLDEAKAAAQADYDHRILPAIETSPSLPILVEALEELVALNNEHSPFGGEFYQDRIDRAWDRARAVLASIKGGQ